MNSNKGLTMARKGRKDEFYTRYQDVCSELSLCAGWLGGANVYCPCDDWRKSNFVKCLVDRFDEFGLRSLTATCYSATATAVGKDSPLWECDEGVGGRPSGTPSMLVVRHVEPGAGMEDVAKDPANTLRDLSGNGDFRSAECVDIMKGCDVVVTNPPFSLFNEMIRLVRPLGKRFLLVGIQAAIGNKSVFEALRGGDVRVKSWPTGAGYFQSVYDDNATSSSHKEGLIRVSGICWYSNIPYMRRDFMTFGRTYDPALYFKYDNADAIDIGKVADIPGDYDGIMGVPLTYMFRYVPEQFEILGQRYGDDGKGLAVHGKEVFARILIRKRKGKRNEG